MDPINQVVPDQLPDEKYIERLFPKCLPKQQNNKMSTSNSRDPQRRPARSKVHQHSRRELEARRAKNKSSSPLNNNNNNFSDSSDESNVANINNSNTNGSLIKKSVSIHGYHGSSKYSTVSSASSSSTRRSGKYMASQSLLQQLQRTQPVTYCSQEVSSQLSSPRVIPDSSNSNNATSNNLNSLNSSTTPEQPTPKVALRERGIVKSNSSYSYLSEPYIISPKYQQHISSQLTKFITRDYEESQDELQQQQLLEDKFSAEGSSKIDNTQSDLLDNLNNNNKPTVSGSAAFESNETKTRLSILKNSTQKEPFTSSSTAISLNNSFSSSINNINDEINNNISDLCNDSQHLIDDDADDVDIGEQEPINDLINKIDRRNILVRSTFNLEEKVENVLNLKNNNVPVCPSHTAVNFLSNQQTTADSVCRAKSATKELSESDDLNDTSVSGFIENQATLDLIHDEPERPLLIESSVVNLNFVTNEEDSKNSLLDDDVNNENFTNFYSTEVGQQKSHKLRPSTLLKSSFSDNKKINQRLTNKAFIAGYTSAGDKRSEQNKRANDENIISSLENSLEVEDESVEKKFSLKEYQLNFDATENFLPVDVDRTVVTTNKYLQELDPTSNIISIQHRASQQLLATNYNDTEENVENNDASIEELCNVSDILNDTEKPSIRDHAILDSEQTEVVSNSNNDNRNSPNDSSNCAKLNTFHKKSRSHINPLLQTVDEKAEIDIDETTPHGNDKTGIRQANDMMLSGQVANLSKKLSVSSDGNERISTSFTSQLEDGQQFQQVPDSLTEEGEVNSSTMQDASTPDASFSSKHTELIDIRTSLTSKVTEVNQRVKFNEQSLVNLKEITNATEKVNQQPINNLANNKRVEHPPQMPSISETNFESEVDAPKELNQAEFQSTPVQDLTTGMIKISLANFTFDQDALFETDYRNEVSTSDCLQQDSPRTLSVAIQQTQDNITVEQQQAGSNLRHYKLPNETAHYSTAKSAIGVVSSTIESSIPSRSSSLQFNTLSDGESGPDELAKSIQKNMITSKKRESNTIENANINTNRNNTVNLAYTKNDDDLTPITKTALIFPRLDEGLSSEAESCDDEPEDDEEKGVDADVDADDDDDDDDDDEDEDDEEDEEVDDEDEGENETNPLGRNGQVVHLGLPNSDSFLRQQSQLPHKTQLRLLNLQSQQSLMGLSTLDSAESQQIKNPSSTSYNGYNAHESLENNNSKSGTNYTNLNGNQTNYCLSISNQQSTPSLPSSSHQYSQRLQNNNSSTTLKQNNNSFNQEEAKGSNRVSSDTDNETDRLLGTQRNDQLKHQTTNSDISNSTSNDLKILNQNQIVSKEVLIEGVLFSVKYLGSTHTDCEGRGEKEDRIHQAEMAVHDVKFRNGDSHTPLEVHLFISTEKIMVLDQRNRKIMMDHSLRTISYIADIGDAIVLIVRKKNPVLNELGEIKYEAGRPAITSKISCHVFESSESHTITKSISQAFQVAYTELLKANNAGDTASYLPKELDYQEVLNSQEMSTNELEMFARKENQREVIVPKERGEILGLSLVESGWGSVLPTVVIASLKPDGPAYRCKKLSVGDQILSINGISLVGLPLANCQEILRKTKKQRVARLSIVPCPITVEVKIKRPDTKYQLGFSVQNGVICSLLRGGIAERGGVRVGHRIMSINGTTVVNVPHEKIVSLLASSVGEIKMKTCLTSLYRFILGEEKPVHF